MAKVSVHTFKLKPANKVKKRKPEIKVSRLCTGIVARINNQWYVDVTHIDNKEEITTRIPLSKSSLDLKGKTHVFTTTPDSTGKYTCIIRSEQKAKINPGSPAQYCVVKNGCVIAGKITSVDGHMVFDYEMLVAYSSKTPYKVNRIVIDENKPLFK